MVARIGWNRFVHRLADDSCDGYASPPRLGPKAAHLILGQRDLGSLHVTMLSRHNA